MSEAWSREKYQPPPSTAFVAEGKGWHKRCSGPSNGIVAGRDDLGLARGEVGRVEGALEQTPLRAAKA